MKKILFILVLFTGAVLFAQTPGKRIKQLKTAYITQELDLSTEEARAFWPIYDEYYEALEAYGRKQLIEVLRNQNDRSETLTPSKAKEITSEFKEAETAIYKARMKLLDDLEGVISDVKIAQLLIAEKNFNKRMLERFRNRN